MKTINIQTCKTKKRFEQLVLQTGPTPSDSSSRATELLNPMAGRVAMEAKWPLKNDC